MENMSNLILTEQQLNWLTSRGVDPSVWNVLNTSIFVGAKPESIMAAVEYCKARGLDILKKPCHIVPMNVKDTKTGRYEWRDIIMPSITEQRITASRTGEYAGQDAPVFGEMVQMQFNKTVHTVPEFCTVTVYRVIHGQKVAFSHTEYFEEICSTTKDGDLNSMWTKRKRGQLAKCAEAGALRKAFPEEIGNEYTAEEMQGKVIDVGEPVSQEPKKMTIEMNLDNDETLLNTVISQIKNGTLDKGTILSGQGGYTFNETTRQKLVVA